MLTVTELANRSGTTPHAVRYYTRLGLLRAERNPDNGYHLYKLRDITWLRFIRQAKQLGYTLNEIKEIMHDADQGRSPCPRVRKIIQQRIVENRLHLEALKRSWLCRPVWRAPCSIGPTSLMAFRMEIRCVT